jgi:hypothetical protein
MLSLALQKIYTRYINIFFASTTTTPKPLRTPSVVFFPTKLCRAIGIPTYIELYFFHRDRACHLGSTVNAEK